MMDLSLDVDQSRKFNCESCDISLQKQRNCLNNYKPKKLILNGNLYEQCPRSLTFNKNTYNYLISLYFNCKKSKTWPNGPSLLGETAYTKEYFDFCDEIVDKYRDKKEKELSRKTEAQNKKGT